MILTILGEDIAKLTLGLLDDNRQVVRAPRDIACLPEDYLAVIHDFLQAEQLTLSQLSGIVVQSAAGSATAQRVTHALVNAFGFAHGIPLYNSVEAEALPIILPVYSGEAKVTARKKDALYRKT